MALMTQVGLEFIAKDRSSRGLMLLNRHLGGLHRSFRRLGVTILSVAGIGGFGYMIRQQMKVIDATAKLSARIGETTENLVALQHGADISGAGAERLSAAIDVLQKRLGEAKQGTGEAANALEAMNLRVEDMIALSPYEQILKISEAMQTIPSQAEKAAITSDLFSRANQKLLNLIDQGPEAIREYRVEVEKLGLSFSRIDAAQVEAANDALTRTRAVFTGLFRQATIELAPYIEAAAEAFVRFATQGEGVGANVVSVFESIALAISEVIAQTESLIIALDKLTSPLDNIKKTSEANQKAIEQYRSITGDVQAFTYPGGPLSTPVQPQNPEWWQIISEGQRQHAGIQPQDRSGEIRAAFDDIRAKAEQTAKAIVEADKSQQKFADTVENTTADMTADVREHIDSVRHQDYLTRMERIQSLEAYRDKHREVMYDVVGEETAAGEMIRKEIESVKNSRLDAMKVYQAELREDMQNLNLYISEKFRETAQTIESSLSNAFYSIIAEGQSFKEAMNQFFIEIGNAFARMVADMIARWIMFQTITAFAGGFGGLFGGGAGGSPSAPTYVPHHEGWIPDTMDSYHGGRRMMQNEHLALIENDELVVPPEKVTRSLNIGGGEPTVNNYITIKALDSQDVQRALRKEKNFIADLNFNSMKSNHPGRRFEKK